MRTVRSGPSGRHAPATEAQRDAVLALLRRLAPPHLWTGERPPPGVLTRLAEITGDSRAIHSRTRSIPAFDAVISAWTVAVESAIVK